MLNTLKNLLLKSAVISLYGYLTLFATSCIAKEELLIAVGLSKPPYVIQKTNKGFELELIKAIFQTMDKRSQFVYTEFGHSKKMLKVEQIDAVMTASQKMFEGHALLSNSYITYQNVAISLKERNLKINEIADLGNYSIASFQSADKVLGEAFAKASQASPLFLAIAIQKQQPLLLLKKRVDVIVMDINIFKHLIREMDLGDIDQLFNFHSIFPPSNYHMAFKDPQLKQEFDFALDSYLQAPAYQQLKKAYNFQ